MIVLAFRWGNYVIVDTWRVYVRDGDLEWAAATAQGLHAELFEIAVRRSLPGGEETYSWSGAYGLSLGSRFGWKRAAPGQLLGAIPGDPSKHQLRGTGYAFDTPVARVIGVTTEGARVEEVP